MTLVLFLFPRHRRAMARASKTELTNVFTVELWNDDETAVVDTLATAGNFHIARAAFDEARAFEDLYHRDGVLVRSAEDFLAHPGHASRRVNDAGARNVLAYPLEKEPDGLLDFFRIHCFALRHFLRHPQPGLFKKAARCAAYEIHP